MRAVFGKFVIRHNCFCYLINASRLICFGVTAVNRRFFACNRQGCIARTRECSCIVVVFQVHQRSVVNVVFYTVFNNRLCKAVVYDILQRLVIFQAAFAFKYVFIRQIIGRRNERTRCNRNTQLNQVLIVRLVHQRTKTNTRFFCYTNTCAYHRLKFEGRFRNRYVVIHRDRIVCVVQCFAIVPTKEISCVARRKRICVAKIASLRINHATVFCNHVHGNRFRLFHYGKASGNRIRVNCAINKRTVRIFIHCANFRKHQAFHVRIHKQSKVGSLFHRIISRIGTVVVFAVVCAVPNQRNIAILILHINLCGEVVFVSVSCIWIIVCRLYNFRIVRTTRLE